MYRQLVELTGHNLVGQEACPPIFRNALDHPIPAARLADLLGQPVGLGLPSEPLKLKATWSTEDVLTMIFIRVEDAYKKLFVTPAYFRARPNATPAFTDAEVIRLAPVQELAG
jgi:hypothetical protein